MARAASRKMMKGRRGPKRSHKACVSKKAKAMFKRSTPRSAKGRGRVLAKAQKACAK